MRISISFGRKLQAGPVSTTHAVADLTFPRNFIHSSNGYSLWIPTADQQRTKFSTESKPAPLKASASKEAVQ
jgi:hypothetical protein